MRRMFKKENLPVLLISLAFSLILFFNVNSSDVSRLISSDDNTYEEAISNVPVTLSYDSNKYFVHGYVSTAAVKLSSANRIQLNKEIDSDTRDFSIVANLEDFKTGTHEVKLRTKNLPTSVSASIEPTTISVTIERRQTKTFDVTPTITNASKNSELSVDQLTVEPSEVEITTGRQTMKEIDRVVVSVDASQLTEDQDSVQGTIQALSGTGESLPIESNVQSVTVTYEQSQKSKEVDLTAVQEGNNAEGIDSYDISLNRQKATITGSASVLKNIDSIEIPVNISEVTDDTTKMINIPTNNYQVSPKSVTVNISVNKTTSDTSTSENSSETASSTTETANNNQSGSSGSSSSTKISGNQTQESSKTEDDSTETSN